jgi:hypothetical protein
MGFLHSIINEMPGVLVKPVVNSEFPDADVGNLP